MSSYLIKCAIVLASCFAAAVPAMATDKPVAARGKTCHPSEQLVRVTKYEDRKDSIHIELVDAATGRALEPIDVTKPWHSGYDKARYPLGRAVCHPLPSKPTEGS